MTLEGGGKKSFRVPQCEKGNCGGGVLLEVLTPCAPNKRASG